MSDANVERDCWRGKSLPRDRVTLTVGQLASNPAKALAGRHDLSNFPDSYRRCVIQLTFRFSVAAPVGAAELFVFRPFSYGSPRDGRGMVPQYKAAQTIATGAQVNANIADGYTQVFTATTSGFDGVQLENQLALGISGLEIDFEVIADPSVDVGT